MYKEYYISSMKLEFRPAHLDAGNAAGYVIHAAQVGTAMDRLIAGPHGPDQYVNAIDYRTYDATRPFKRFYRVYKYAKQKSLIWRSCTDAITGLVGGFNVLPNC